MNQFKTLNGACIVSCKTAGGAHEVLKEAINSHPPSPKKKKPKKPKKPLNSTKKKNPNKGKRKQKIIIKYL